MTKVLKSVFLPKGRRLQGNRKAIVETLAVIDDCKWVKTISKTSVKPA